MTAEATGRNGDIAAAMVDMDVEVPGVSESGKLLTLSTSGAVEHGIADAEADSLAAALETLGLASEVSDRTLRDVFPVDQDAT